MSAAAVVWKLLSLSLSLFGSPDSLARGESHVVVSGSTHHLVRNLPHILLQQLNSRVCVCGTESSGGGSSSSSKEEQVPNPARGSLSQSLTPILHWPLFNMVDMVWRLSLSLSLSLFSDHLSLSLCLLPMSRPGNTVLSIYVRLLRILIVCVWCGEGITCCRFSCDVLSLSSGSYSSLSLV